MKRILFTLCILALTVTGCAREAAPAPELLTPVGSQTDACAAVTGRMEDMEIFEAAVAPGYELLYFTHEARIGKLHARLGDRVNAGDIVAEMDVSSVEGDIAQLNAEKESLKADAEYEKALYDIDMELFALRLKSLSGDEAYDLETEMALYELEYKNAADARDERLRAIDAETAELAAKLEGTSIVSPCSGRVTYICGAPGQTVGAYDTVCVVADESSLILQSDFISPAAIASAVEIYAVTGGERVEITPIELDGDEYSRAMLRGVEYLSSFSFDAPGAVPGQTAVICVVTSRLENVLKVPINAVFMENDEYYVYLMDGESRSRSSVGVGLMTSTEAEITSGLEEGDVLYVGD
jgi:macrolide-specific efflux system membrane fusion protein